MDLSISPDVEAYYCYLIVLLIGAAVARKRVSELLEGFRGAWVKADTWVLLGVYTLLPVALFWLLDRTGALHDTSLLGAAVVAIGYRQIITGGVQGLAAPSQLTGAWQPLVNWTDRVAARIRDRIQRFNARYEERLLTSIVGDRAKMDNLIQLAQSHAPNPADVDTQLKTLASTFAALGPAGVARKQAAWLYRSLKAVPNLDYEHLMYQQGVIKRRWYLWYVREWRSKALASGVIVLVLLGAWWGFPRIRTPENDVWYYLARLQKTNGTQYDRYRAREKLSALLHGPQPAAVRALSQRVTSLLRYEALPLETAESLLGVLVEHRAVADKHGSSLGPGLAQSLRTSNPDIRSRIQKALVLLAADRKKVLPNDLRDWSPSKQDSLQELEDRIQQWSALWASP